MQRRIQNRVEQPKWSFLRKQLSNGHRGRTVSIENVMQIQITYTLESRIIGGVGIIGGRGVGHCIIISNRGGGGGGGTGLE